VRLADYIVSYSLQINNRCLRFLADSHAKGNLSADGGLVEGDDSLLEVQPVYAESMLLRDSRRLGSLWRWVASEDARVNAHRQELSEVLERLNDNAAPTRLALRLASQAAGEEDATNLLLLARSLPTHQDVSWMRLNELFTTDSDLWRNDAYFESLADEELLAKLLFSYRKGYKVNQKLPSGWPTLLSDQKVEKNLSRQKEYCQFSTHQLELLRPGLSDKGKRQLWYLDKLADAHRMLHGLLQLQSLIPKTALRKPVAKSVKKYVITQSDKIYKRIERLAPRAYNVRPKRFQNAIQQGLSGLGLEAVLTLQSSPQAEITPKPAAFTGLGTNRGTNRGTDIGTLMGTDSDGSDDPSRNV
jgi:hypothetical protein